MMGAIIGDLVGSRFEWKTPPKRAFSLITKESHVTDDTIMTIAVAKALMSVSLVQASEETLSRAVIHSLQSYGRRYPNAGYGARFTRWLQSDHPAPYGSYGNGAAMRISPCAYVAHTLDEALDLAVTVTSVTHDHPEGILGACAVTEAIYRARRGEDKAAIKKALLAYYDLSEPLCVRQKTYFDGMSCQETVPLAILCFLEACDFIQTIRLAVSLGGDTDTIAAMAGSMAEPYYGVSEELQQVVWEHLPEDLGEVVKGFQKRFQMKYSS